MRVTDPTVEEGKAEDIYEEAIRTVKAVFDSVSQEKEIILSKGIERDAARIVERLSAGDESLISLVSIGSKDNYLYNHSVNTCILAVKVGLSLGYSRGELRELAICSLLHDLGMAKLPKGIWAKPGKLTEEEFSEVKKHPVYGREISAKIVGISPLVAEVVHQQHERADGQGYPQGIKYEEIHEYAKLIALIDVYEALTHERAYRKGYMPNDAIKMIIDGSGQLFSPPMVKALVKELSIYPVGSLVRLNTNEAGRVVATNKGFPIRPQVEVLFDADGEKLKEPKTINLGSQPSLHIKEPLSESEL